jgi:hypothetical protein
MQIDADRWAAAFLASQAQIDQSNNLERALDASKRLSKIESMPTGNAMT